MTKQFIIIKHNNLGEIMNNSIKFCDGENIYLRPFDETIDLDLFHSGENDPMLRESLFLNSPLTKDSAREKINNWISNSENRIFTICETETDIPIGITGLFRVDLVSRAAVFYIAIYNSQFWSKGYGKEATKLVLQYSFNTLNLNRVQLHVATTNTKGIKAYENAGFVIEGTLREAMYQNNKYIDFYVMGILQKEFYEKHK